jgi:hypothetical protein
MTYHHRHGTDGFEWNGGRHSPWSAVVLGLGVFVLGGILMLDTFDVIDGGVLAPLWPGLLAVVGISCLVGPSPARKLVCGLSWIAVGAIMLLANLGVIAVGPQALWPVILVILGVNLLVRGVRRGQRGGGRDQGPGSTPVA